MYGCINSRSLDNKRKDLNFDLTLDDDISHGFFKIYKEIRNSKVFKIFYKPYSYFCIYELVKIIAINQTYSSKIIYYYVENFIYHIYAYFNNNKN